MEEYFNKFLENIELKPDQKTDARRKYKGVCEKVHNSFYDSKYNGSTQYLFGSYKKKTNIRPIIPEQDVDVLIKLPFDVYEQYDEHEGNGQSKLIQKIKDILNEKYTTTDNIKGWGKVILVQFAENKHNVELLPAFENEDGTFKIPNTSDGGSWEIFDPKEEIDVFKKSNDNTGGITRKLSKMVKKWAREVNSLNIKSYILENYVIDFLEDYKYSNKKLSIIIRDFYEWFTDNVDEDNKSYVETAFIRIKKAINYIISKKYEKAVDEWKKVFGKEFPKSISIKKNFAELYKAPDESFIEEYHSIILNPDFHITLDCEIQQDGFRPKLLSYFLSNKFKLQKKKNLKFFLSSCNIPEPFELKWKIRNYGMEAEEKECLRGEIINDSGNYEKVEYTSYFGDHMVECFVIKNNICVARTTIEVPIENSL